MRWPPPTPSAVMLVAGSLALALASQDILRVQGITMASAAAIATLASYGRLYSSTSSRSFRADPPALTLALSPYALALVLEGPSLIPWYIPPALAFAVYLLLSSMGRGRSPAGLTAGAISLASLSAAFSGMLRNPLPSAVPLCAAWTALGAFEVLFVESVLPFRRIPRGIQLVPLSAGLVASLVSLPPLGLAFIEPLYMALRYMGREVNPREVRALGLRVAVSSSIFLAIGITVALFFRR